MEVPLHYVLARYLLVHGDESIPEKELMNAVFFLYESLLERFLIEPALSLDPRNKDRLPEVVSVLRQWTFAGVIDYATQEEIFFVKIPGFLQQTVTRFEARDKTLADLVTFPPPKS